MIVVNLDVVMARRKMTLSQLAEKVDITLANLSILKNNKAKAVRFSPLNPLKKSAAGLCAGLALFLLPLACVPPKSPVRPQVPVPAERTV